MNHNMQPFIRRQRTGTYRFTAGPTFINVDGVMVPGAAGAYFDADANVQPASGKTMRMLPEGTLADDVRDVWVATLETITPSEAVQPDGSGGRRGHSVTVDGVVYEVVRAKDWRANGGYWELSIQKVAR